jgi:hypothetical protein
MSSTPTLIEIPDFNWSGFYYPEILEDLIQYKRQNLIEWTDEDPTEPLIQLLRAFSLVGHGNNVLGDHVARETMFVTCRLRTSIASHLELIGYFLSQATPAQASMLAKLSATFAAAIELIPEGSEFATRASDDAEAISYEILEALSLSLRTDLVGGVYGYDAGTAVFTDHTAEAQTPTGTFTVDFSDGSGGDILYIGHPDVMFDKIWFNILTAGTDYVAVWEYYDGEYDEANPGSVSNEGSYLKHNLDAWLGAGNDYTGMSVRVRLATTGVYEDVTVYNSGGINYVDTGFLGQVSPSVVATDYLVGTAWNPLQDFTDGTSTLKTAGTDLELEFTLPKTVDEDWKKTTINGVEAYWMRLRTVSGPSGVNPVVYEIRITTGDQYVSFTASQGDSKTDDPIGSSTGLPNQTFQLTESPVIDASLEIQVDESGTWVDYTKVTSFVSSNAYDRHYTARYDDIGVCTLKFGNGTNGKIPPAGTDNIRGDYRIIVGGDGNVGAGSIVVNKSGVSYLDTVSNTRAAAGYEAREGDDADDIERLKVDGPATVRTGGKACTPPDVVDETKAFVASDGSRPFERCAAYEEVYGPKTVEAVVVGTAGVGVTTELLEELEEHFNDPDEGILLFNHELTAVNYTQKSIDVTATVYGGTLASIETALAAKLNPLAKDDEGILDLWEFGEDVPTSMIIHIIMGADPAPRRVLLTTPGADVPLTDHELPVTGTLTITVLP